MLNAYFNLNGHCIGFTLIYTFFAYYKKITNYDTLKNRNIYKSSVNSPISMYLKEKKTENIYQDPSTISKILPVKKGFETFF